MSGTPTIETNPLPSVSISIDDLKHLAEKLQAKAYEAAGLQSDAHRDAGINQSKKDGHSEDELRDAMKKLFEITIHAKVKGEPLITERGVETLDKAELREDLESIEIECRLLFERFMELGTQPKNWFSLFFDFTKPPVFDWRNPVSNPTPNNSNLTICGSSHSWVSGVKDDVKKLLDKRRKNRTWLHAPFMYDLGLFVVGLPVIFVFLWLASPHIESFGEGKNSVLVGALYVYGFFLGLHVYRICFFAIRWAFPKVEISDQVTFRQKLGRIAITTISISASVASLVSLFMDRS